MAIHEARTNSSDPAIQELQKIVNELVRALSQSGVFGISKPGDSPGSSKVLKRNNNDYAFQIKHGEGNIISEGGYYAEIQTDSGGSWSNIGTLRAVIKPSFRFTENINKETKKRD